MFKRGYMKYYVDELNEDVDGQSGYGVFHIDTGRCKAIVTDYSEALEICNRLNS